MHTESAASAAAAHPTAEREKVLAAGPRRRPVEPISPAVSLAGPRDPRPSVLCGAS